MYQRRIIAVVSIAAMAGCGGGSSSNQKLLDNRIARGDALEAQFADATDAVSAVLPGKAEYTGTIVAGGGVNKPGEAFGGLRFLFEGELVLDVDFADGELTGEGRNFVQVRNLDALLAGDIATGTLSINGARSDDPDKVEFDVIIDGRIEGTSGAFIDLEQANISTTTDAVGPNAEVIGFDTKVDVELGGEDGYVRLRGIAGR